MHTRAGYFHHNPDSTFLGKMPFQGVQINIHNIHFVNSTFNIFNSNVPIRVCPEFTNFQLIFSFRAGGAKKNLIFSQHPLHFLHEFRISGAQYSKKYLRFAPEARKKIMIFTSSHPTFSSEFTPEAWKKIMLFIHIHSIFLTKFHWAPKAPIFF